MKSQRDFILYLEDMANAIRSIQEFVANVQFSSFVTNQMMRDAVVRNIEIIGEAASKIPPDVQERYPEIPWKQMYIVRNIIAHEYFGIDYDVVWKIAQDYLPKNFADLKRVIEEETKRRAT